MYVSRTGTGIENLSSNPLAVSKGYNEPLRNLTNIIERMAPSRWIRAHPTVAEQ